ncbi:hypothetical protein F2P81_019928 [Scophthalmus maximus]|uniref:Uncharacterized protein n=1 Tax=Scophthalmus maximus TaxID=52904 RepID=A0A6A4S2F7_SCOMX|nr:hypothetical protein F2P81_019928 [Scophthalmus maximus]
MTRNWIHPSPSVDNFLIFYKKLHRHVVWPRVVQLGASSAYVLQQMFCLGQHIIIIIMSRLPVILTASDRKPAAPIKSLDRQTALARPDCWGVFSTVTETGLYDTL